MSSTGYKFLLVVVFAGCALAAGCATAPASPYWNDAHWIDQLGAKVQTSLVESRAVADRSGDIGNVAVGFTYDAGALQDVHILQSTGSTALDDAITATVAQTRPPAARGPWATTPHTFALALYVGAGWTRLVQAIHQQIQQHVDYPLPAMLNGAQGVVVTRFGYLDGRVLDPRVTQSSGVEALDQSALDELSTLTLPPPPSVLRGRRLIFQSTVCFNRHTPACPRSAGAVYFVASRADVQPCSEVSFRYRHGKIADVRLARATEYASLDKLALRLVAQGEFPAPAIPQASGRALLIPVCYTFNMQSANGPLQPGDPGALIPGPHAVRVFAPGRPSIGLHVSRRHL